MTSAITLFGQSKSATLFYTGNDTSTRFLNAVNDVVTISAMGKKMMPNNQVALAAGKQEKIYLYQMKTDINGNTNQMVCLNHRGALVGLSTEDRSVWTKAPSGNMAIYPIEVGSNTAGPVFVIGNDQQPSGVIQCLSESTGAPLMQDITTGCVQFNALATRYVG